MDCLSVVNKNFVRLEENIWKEEFNWVDSSVVVDVPVELVSGLKELYNFKGIFVRVADLVVHHSGIF